MSAPYPVAAELQKFENETRRAARNQHGDRSLAAVPAKPQVVNFSFTSLDSLLAEPEELIAFVVDRMLPRGGFSIMAGKPKAGKSTAARQLAVSISRGEVFLGRSCGRGKVVYLCLEEKRSEIAAHFRRMGASGQDILIHTGSSPADALTALDFAIEEYSPALVIIDPLSRFVRMVDFNSYAEATRQLEPLIDMARSSKCQTHIMALHHNGKNGERESGDALLGSTGFFGAVDALLSVKKRERARTIETIQRYGEDLPETIIHLDPATGIVSACGDLKEFTLNERKNLVLESMTSDPIAETAIKEVIGGNGGLTSQAIRALFDEGKLSRTGRGRKGDPFLYARPPIINTSDETLADEIYFPPGATDEEIHIIAAEAEAIRAEACGEI
jgi:hypothetical protein